MSINENAPKPKPPLKKPVVKEEKKPYKRKEHLTQRPFTTMKDIRHSLSKTNTDGGK